MDAKRDTNIVLRQAQPEDAAALAEICFMADPEVFQYLYNGLLPDDRGIALMRKLCATTDTTYSYERFTLATREGEVVGGFNAVPSDRLGPLDGNLEAVLLKRLRLTRWSMVRWFLRRMALASRAESISVPSNSLLICNLAVSPRYRGLGVGRNLLEAATTKAETGRFHSLSLFVWEDREDAVRLYLRNGFRVEQASRFRSSAKLPHDGRALMVRWLKVASE